MAGAPSSITRTGAHEPFELQVSRGQIPWHRSISVFGYSPDIDTTRATVWPGVGERPQLTAATIFKVSSSSTNDASAGTGARTILVQGLDANFAEISETVALNGQTSVDTTKQYLRINKLTVLTTGSGNSNAGVIYIGTGVVTLGVPATIQDLIPIGYNTTVTGHYTVPAGYTAYVAAGSIGVGQGGGSNPITGFLLTMSPTNIEYVAAVVTLNNGYATFDFVYPVQIPEKTDIEAAAIGATNNNQVSSYFNMVLIKNDAGTP